jgi:hypothetical protein
MLNLWAVGIWIQRDLRSIFWFEYPVFPTACLFFSVCFSHLCWRLSVYWCVGLFTGLLFCCSMCLFLCSTMLVLLIQLCNIIWSQVLSYL